MHIVRDTFGYVSDIAEANTALHGEEALAFGDAGHHNVERRPDANANVTWHVAMRPGKCRALDKDNAADATLERAEKLKAGARAKVKHPFQVIKRQFGSVQIRYRGLKKNTAQILTVFALSNLWTVRGKLVAAWAQMRPKARQRPCKRRKNSKRPAKTTRFSRTSSEIPPSKN